MLQKRIILEHAKLLQRELAIAKELQLWTAPRNTEISVAERRQSLTSVDDVRVSKALIAEALEGPKVGFEPEQYQDASVGFYVRLQVRLSRSLPPHTGLAGGAPTVYDVPRLLHARGRMTAHRQRAQRSTHDTYRPMRWATSWQKRATRRAYV